MTLSPTSSAYGRESRRSSTAPSEKSSVKLLRVYRCDSRRERDLDPLDLVPDETPVPSVGKRKSFFVSTNDVLPR